MRFAKDYFTAAWVAILWWGVGWQFGDVPSLLGFAKWNFIAAGFTWGLSVLWRGYQKRRARMRAEWEFYRELARPRDEA
jgi:hypothetical protein